VPNAAQSTTRTASRILSQRWRLCTLLTLALCLLLVWYRIYEGPGDICQKAIDDLLSQPQLTMGYAHAEPTSLNAEDLSQCHGMVNSLKIMRARYEGHGISPACGNICIRVTSPSREQIIAYVKMDSIGMRINDDYYNCRFEVTPAVPMVGSGPFGQFLNRLHQIPDPNW
jgi:hypothetical protein